MTASTVSSENVATVAATAAAGDVVVRVDYI